MCFFPLCALIVVIITQHLVCTMWVSLVAQTVKNPPTTWSSVPGLERSPGEGNGNPLQYSCLENPKDRGACWATVHGVAKCQT